MQLAGNALLDEKALRAHLQALSTKFSHLAA
jgi:hypothetical protein